MGHSCPPAARGLAARCPEGACGGGARMDTEVTDVISCPSLVCPLPREAPSSGLEFVFMLKIPNPPPPFFL